MKPTLAIDFDGVLHGYSLGWHDGTIYDGPMPGAYEALKELSQTHNLVVYTTRQSIDQIAMWLGTMLPGIPLHVSNEKPRAVAYIDDRAVRFRDWNHTLDELREIGIIEDDEPFGIHIDVYP